MGSARKCERAASRIIRAGDEPNWFLNGPDLRDKDALFARDLASPVLGESPSVVAGL